MESIHFSGEENSSRCRVKTFRQKRNTSEDITPIERAKVINEYLSPFAEGKKIKTLLINYRMKRNTPKKFAHTVSALCKMTGKSPITFIRWLSLLALPEDLQKKVDSPNSPITSRHIEHLLKLEDFQTMRKVVQRRNKKYNNWN